MSDRAKLRYEILTIAQYKGLMLSKHLLIYLLIAASFFSMYYGYSGSPIYILMIIIFLPYIFHEILQKCSLQDPIIILKNTAKRFHYNRLASVTNNIGYTTSIFLMLLWYLNFSTINHSHAWFFYTPSVLLIVTIASRLLSTLYYIQKLHYSLKV